MMHSQGNYYITQDADGGLRAVAFTKMWVEKDGETYRLCATTVDGSVMNLHQDESIKAVNRELLLRAGVHPIRIAAMEVNEDADVQV